MEENFGRTTPTSRKKGPKYIASPDDPRPLAHELFFFLFLLRYPPSPRPPALEDPHHERLGATVVVSLDDLREGEEEPWQRFAIEYSVMRRNSLNAVKGHARKKTTMKGKEHNICLMKVNSGRGPL